MALPLWGSVGLAHVVLGSAHGALMAVPLLNAEVASDQHTAQCLHRPLPNAFQFHVPNKYAFAEFWKDCCKTFPVMSFKNSEGLKYILIFF